MRDTRYYYMLTRHAGRLLAATAILLLGLSACSDDDDSAGPEVGTDVEDLTGEDEDAVADSPLIGQEVTVSGEVSEIVGANGFEISGPEGDLLILTSGAASAEAVPGTLVQVEGTVREVLVETFDADFGFEYDPALYGDFENRLAVSATEVVLLEDGAAGGVPAANVVLEELNDSGVDGDVALVLEGNQLSVTASAEDFSPALAHPMHLRFGPELTPECPDIETFDIDGDEVLTTAEGDLAFGPIQISLTTDGDTTPASALALDRFPAAGIDGRLAFERTIELDQATADMLRQAAQVAVVVHGQDLDESGVYDGAASSSIDRALPLEATIPVACGTASLS